MNRRVVHFVLDTDNRRAIEVPGEPVARGDASDDLVGEEWVDVMHGVELHRGGVAPRGVERRHAPLRLAEPPDRLPA
jgi:hypothetical protein